MIGISDQLGNVENIEGALRRVLRGGGRKLYKIVARGI